MKHWTRWCAAAAVALFALPVFAAAPEQAPTGGSANVDPLWPAESQQVFKINVRQILDSDIIKKYALAQLKQAMEGRNAQDTLKDLGLDPLKDFDSISGGLWGDDPRDMHGVVIIRGKFDSAKLFEAAEKAAAKDGDKISIVKEGDTKLIKVVVDQIPEPLFATMADDKTIIVGTDKKLTLDGVKASDNKSKPVIKDELADLVKAADEKASMFFVGLSSGKVNDIPPNPIFEDTEKLKKQLESMKSSAMTLRVTTDISLEMIMMMKDEDSANDFGATMKELMDKARVFLPIIAMQAPQAKAIVDDLKKHLNSEVKGKNIQMKMKITGDAIGKAVGADE